MSDDLEETINTVAQEPAKANIDGQLVEQHPIADLIEADKHLAAKRAASRNAFGLSFRQFEPGGCG